MRIIISDVDEGEVYIEFERSPGEKKGATFSDVYSRLMIALEGAITTILEEAPAVNKQAYREHMYDIIDDGFGNLLAKVFPEIKPDEFDLTAAAIVYAQDQIINKAEAEGKTYQEMLDEYEAIADKYVAEKRLH